jgi:hypothetical protein
MLTRFIKTAMLAVPLFAIVGCASVTRVPTYGLDPGGAALVRQTCSDVMGLTVGVAEFDACGDSLAQSVLVRNDADLIARTSAHCEREGFEPGTAALAKCVVLSKRTLAQSAFPEPAGADQQTERMELSCAHLGLYPGSGAFKQCVTNLRNALFFVQNPL